MQYARDVNKHLRGKENLVGPGGQAGRKLSRIASTVRRDTILGDIGGQAEDVFLYEVVFRAADP